jgi:hypothetical protein
MFHRPMGTPKKEPAPAAANVSELVKDARALLQSEGVVKISALGPKAVRELVLAELSKLGFEVTKAAVRAPIAAQLAAALADGAFIPLKRIAAHARGATAVEAKQVALALVSDGRATLVVRGTEEVLVPIGSGVVPRSELLGFDALAKAVAKIARSKSGATLLRSDLTDALAEALPETFATFTSRAPSNPITIAKERSNAAFQQLLSAVDATRDSNTGLSFVPAIVARLRPDLSADAARAVLEHAANSGLLELRPEGGINRLSAEELSLCPPGPQGTRLSWARRTESVA